MAEAAKPVRRGGHGIARALSFIVIGLTVLAVLGFAALRWIDSESGRAFVVRQLPLVKPQSGLRITAGRIDGSLFGKAVIHDMVLSDPKGRFAEVPRLALDWRPLDLINKTFRARDIAAPVVRILRLPSLNPSTDDRILPDFDFDIGRLAIDRLILEAPVSGQRRVLSVGGNADIRWPHQGPACGADPARKRPRRQRRHAAAGHRRRARRRSLRSRWRHQGPGQWRDCRIARAERPARCHAGR
jgi:translocation and assembly module TamB